MVQAAGCARWVPGWLRSELRALLALAIPVVVQASAQQALTVTDQVFLGHIGTAELGAAALGNAYTNLMWFFLLGFATALDTLGSHAYGAGDHRALTTWCLTAGMLVTVLVVPIAAAMAAGEWVGAALFSQDAHTSALMGQFCKGLIWGMWPLMWGIVLVKYLQVQNIMVAPAVIAVATCLLNVGFNAVLVKTLGFRGAPLATSLSRCANFLMLVACVWWLERRRARTKAPRPARGSFDASPHEGLLDDQASTSTDVALAIRTELRPLACQRPPATDAPFTRAQEPNGQRDASRDDTDGTCIIQPGEPDLGDPAGGYALAAAAAVREPGGKVPGTQHHLARPCGEEAAPASLHGETVAREGSGRAGGHDGRPGGDDGAASAEACTVAPPLPPGTPPGTAAAGAAPRGTLRGMCLAAMQPVVVLRFLRLGIPGGLSMAFEAGCFDISTVMAGRLGPIITAAHTSVISIVTLSYVAFPFALATAGAIRVGNFLGAGQAAAARRAAVLPIALSGLFMAAVGVVLLGTHRVLGYAFSNDPEVVRVIALLTLFAASLQVSDGLMGSSQGVLRGCGRQTLTAVNNLVGFWVFGVLLGYLLCFHAGWGIRGLWTGIMVGDATVMALNFIVLSRIRWSVEADKAVARLKALAAEVEKEEAMLAGAPLPPATAGGSGAVGAINGGGGGSGPSAVVGGGRAYAGGLRRVWSERRVQRKVLQLRQRRAGDMGERQDSRLARLLRSVSSLFRRGEAQGSAAANPAASGGSSFSVSELGPTPGRTPPNEDNDRAGLLP